MGLGNPGPRYASTRHNIGFELVSALARRHALARGPALPSAEVEVGRVGEAVIAVVRPQTFMNASGDVLPAVQSLILDFDPTRHLLVVYDDIDLPFGRVRLRPSGKSGGHHGVDSIVEILGQDRFPRLRFGIGHPPAGVSVVRHVLQAFSDEETEQMAGRVDVALGAVEHFLEFGIAAAMEQFNGPHV